VKIQAALSAEAALLAWLDLPGQPRAADLNGEHWAVLLRSAGPPVWVRLSGSGQKAAWTEADTRLPGELREALQSPRGSWQPLARRLRQQRLQPLASYLQARGGLPAVRRLIVLPSTALAGVPVEVIAPECTVSYAHSGTMHAHLHRQPAPSGKGLLALADPIFDPPPDKEKPPPLPPGGDYWPRLPGTRCEVASLQRLFSRAPMKILMDSDASEQQLAALASKGELGTYRYVHLATHGEVDNALPLHSAVILSRDHLPDDKQRQELLVAGQLIPDGRLTAEEVLQRWHLHCDLVTLSACQSALGKYEHGEGYVGFAQALILAGSSSVCLSLWKVDDAATALLMERFYQNLLGKRPELKGPMSKVQALAEAKSWLRGLSQEEARQRVADLNASVARGKGRKLQLLPASADSTERPFAHPYYWAAFVLIGQAD
jgi:CHAT domain-containing protein